MKECSQEGRREKGGRGRKESRGGRNLLQVVDELRLAVVHLADSGSERSFDRIRLRAHVFAYVLHQSLHSLLTFHCIHHTTA